MTAASPICSVAPTCPAERGWWTAVWPCEPMRSTSSSGTPAAARDRDGRLGEGLAEQHVEVAELGGVGLGEAEDPLAQRARERRASRRRAPCSGWCRRPPRCRRARRRCRRRWCPTKGRSPAARGARARRRGAASGARSAAVMAPRSGGRSGRSPTIARSEPLCATSSSRARAAETPAWCMTSATLARPPAFSISLRAAASSRPGERAHDADGARPELGVGRPHVDHQARRRSCRAARRPWWRWR